jgi:hypothetical protein
MWVKATCIKRNLVFTAIEGHVAEDSGGVGNGLVAAAL